jgi:replicative DNA helicase
VAATPTTKVPPHNADAEASVLGGVILRNDALRLIGTLRPEEFFDPRHREVFAAMKCLEAQAAPIDPVTIEAELSRLGKLPSVGGLSFLSELMDAVPTADNVGHYAKIIQAMARRRELIERHSESEDRLGSSAQTRPSGSSWTARSRCARSFCKCASRSRSPRRRHPGTTTAL